MRISIAGLATSHPSADARTLCRYADLVGFGRSPGELRPVGADRR